MNYLSYGGQTYAKELKLKLKVKKLTYVQVCILLYDENGNQLILTTGDRMLWLTNSIPVQQIIGCDFNFQN